VFKLQGLSSFNPFWIGVTYIDSLTNTDVDIVSYQTLNYVLSVQAQDMFLTDSTHAKIDDSYVINQGSTDVYLNYGAYDPSAYFVCLYKRKFQTGDVNRDIDVSSGNNTFCFILGNNIAYSSFSPSQRICLNLTLTTSYYSNFRIQNTTNSTGVINYTTPANNVVVIKAY
jgi:hypothetical protein